MEREGTVRKRGTWGGGGGGVDGMVRTYHDGMSDCG